MNELNGPVLKISHLSKQFAMEAGFFAKNKKNVFAVNDVSFQLEAGSTYGIVGESGCGKTTTARLIIQMYKENSGKILINRKLFEDENLSETEGKMESAGSDEFFQNSNSHKTENFFDADGDLYKPVFELNRKELRKYREKVKYIFQDPARSLNPRMTVFDVLTSGLRYSSQWKGKKEARRRCEKIIQEVGLSPEDLNRRPSEFSGGQRQRISIARGLIMNPQVMICDEVVSALDVSIQGQIINLLQKLRKTRGLSYIFITHDLKVACYFCDKIGVMYRGVLVEEASAEDLYKSAVHPYTKLLFEGASGVFTESNVEVKTTFEKENCCPFAYRCPKASERCFNELPEFKETSENHKVRCFL